MYTHGLKEEMDHRCCRGEGALVLEKGERRVHRGLHKKNTSPKPLAGKMRTHDFHEYFQAVTLKHWNFRGLWPGWDRAARALPYFWKEGRQAVNPGADGMI